MMHQLLQFLRYTHDRKIYIGRGNESSLDSGYVMYKKLNVPWCYATIDVHTSLMTKITRKIFRKSTIISCRLEQIIILLLRKNTCHKLPYNSTYYTINITYKNK